MNREQRQEAIANAIEAIYVPKPLGWSGVMDKVKGCPGCGLVKDETTTTLLDHYTTQDGNGSTEVLRCKRCRTIYYD
jgi:hypothetical protein